MPGRTFFPNLAKIITFAAAPLVLTLFVRNQDIYTHTLTGFKAYKKGVFFTLDFTGSFFEGFIFWGVKKWILFFWVISGNWKSEYPFFEWYPEIENMGHTPAPKSSTNFLVYPFVPNIVHWLPNGVGTRFLFTEGPQLHYILSYLFWVLTFWSHFPMKDDYGESRHFCDDPVCPDPVWKLSKTVFGMGMGMNVAARLSFLPVATPLTHTPCPPYILLSSLLLLLLSL